MSYIAPNIPQSVHCFFGSQGGVSKGLYKSLNVNGKSGDNHSDVVKNLDIIANHYELDRSHLMLINQGITSHAEFVNEVSQNKITADGVVTNQKDIILCIGTADCAPVLFYDEKHQIIGAAHTGWRGAVRGIIENTLDIMLAHGAEKSTIAAAIGPCLLQSSFETGLDMYQEFVDSTADNARYFISGRDAEHFQFDMQGFIFSKLKAYGITNISVSDIDTYKEEEHYFSFRRNTHQGLVKSPKDFPSHLSTIKL